jgi:hypothetical protein
MSDKTIKATLLEPGHYRLSQDIQNPHVDRRVKHDWWLLPTIPAGARFLVEQRMVKSLFDNEDQLQTSVLRVWNDGSYSVVGWWCDGDEGTERWNLIAENLLPVNTMDLRGLFAQEGFHNLEYRILEELLASGKLTLKDIEEAGTAAYRKLEE